MQYKGWPWDAAGKYSLRYQTEQAALDALIPRLREAVERVACNRPDFTSFRGVRGRLNNRRHQIDALQRALRNPRITKGKESRLKRLAEAQEEERDLASKYQRMLPAYESWQATYRAWISGIDWEGQARLFIDSRTHTVDLQVAKDVVTEIAGSAPTGGSSCASIPPAKTRTALSTPTPKTDSNPSALDAITKSPAPSTAAPSPALPPRPLTPKEARQAYRKLVYEVESKERYTYGERRISETSRPIRLEGAKRAVLLRCQGWCENPDCGGQPTDVTDSGQAILEVDHVEDLALGGRDHPVNMVALCPNCHAMKTHGRARESLREVLRKVAAEAHAALNAAQH